jgi:hypothetical protein
MGSQPRAEAAAFYIDVKKWYHKKEFSFLKIQGA